MTLFSGTVLFSRHMPGLFVNIFGGILCSVVVIHLLVMYDDDVLSGLPSFLKWFITCYTSVLWLVIIVWSLRNDSPSQWQEELKSWAVAVVGVCFFLIIHIDLEIPITRIAWKWVVYVLL